MEGAVSEHMLCVLFEGSKEEVWLTLLQHIQKINPVTPKLYTQAQCHCAGILNWGFKFLVLTLRKKKS
jgi:hypothetical protein